MTAVSDLERLILVRHGRTGWNAEGRYQGHADPPLDSTGQSQAAQLADGLSPFGPALVVSSDLTRARQTAERIAQASGCGIRLDPGLREQDLGGWTGLSDSEAADAYPQEHRAWKAGLTGRRGGGESEGEVVCRMVDAVARALADAPGGGPVIVVSHGLAIQALLLRIAGPSAAIHLANGRWIGLRGLLVRA